MEDISLIIIRSVLDFKDLDLQMVLTELKPTVFWGTEDRGQGMD